MAGPSAGSNPGLLSGPADIVALKGDSDPTGTWQFRDDPPIYGADGKINGIRRPSQGKIMLLDSDHIGSPTCLASGSTPAWCDTGWPWKVFTRGYHPVFMDTVRTLWPGDVGGTDANGDGILDDPTGLVGEGTQK